MNENRGGQIRVMSQIPPGAAFVNELLGEHFFPHCFAHFLGLPLCWWAKLNDCFRNSTVHKTLNSYCPLIKKEKKSPVTSRLKKRDLKTSSCFITSPWNQIQLQSGRMMCFTPSVIKGDRTCFLSTKDSTIFPLSSRASSVSSGECCLSHGTESHCAAAW